MGRLIGGRYRIDRELGCGPGTQTLLVTDLRNGRPCVLRQLSMAQAPPAAVRRFEFQAAILVKFDHPGLPRFVAGFSEGEGDAQVRVVVSSYHPGENLERLVAKGRPLTESQALVLLRRIVPVLVYLHGFEPPLVHRTISATGIILGPDGRPCLTDLDFAGAEPAVPSPEHAPPGPEELALAAPEVFMGGPVPASDIYALGLAVCRGMTVRDPALLLREGTRVQLRGALGASEAFAAVIARMLEPSLERRYQDARALDVDLAKLAGVRLSPAQQLSARAAEEPRRRRNVRPLVFAGVALALAALAAVAMRLRTEEAVPETSLLVPAAPQDQAAAPAPPAGTGVVTEPTPSAETPPAAGTPDSSPPAAPAPETPVQGADVAAPAPDASESSTPAPASQPPPVPPGTAVPVLEGRLRLDGKPFAGTGAPDPSFWLRNESTKVVEKVKVNRTADGFTVADLAPGRYSMSVRVDLNPSNPGRFPGDLDAWRQFSIKEGSPVTIELPLRRIIRLLQPVDTNVAVRGWEEPCGAGSALPGKIVFAWEPLPSAANYQARIDRLACARGNASVGTVFSRSTTDTWVKVELPPSTEGECYSFSLTASRDEVPVGIMTTHGKTGLGWDYRFTVAGR